MLSKYFGVLNRSFTNCLILVFSTAIFIGCGEEEFTPIPNNSGAPDQTVVLTPGPNNTECAEETFTQPDSNYFNKVDVLFVTDTSGSLDPERALVASGISNFVSRLPDGTDLQVAVMLAHGSTSNHSGKLFRKSSEPTVLKSSELSITSIKSHLHSKLTGYTLDWYDPNSTVDWGSDGGEQGLFSLNKALEPARLASIRSQHGFFRTDAALAVIFVSDENDICAQYPAGVTPVPDPPGYEQDSYNRDCSGITVSGVYSKIRSTQGLNPFLIGGVMYTNPATVPPEGENEYGYGYMDLINMSEGLAVDIGSNIASGLAAIGSLVSEKLDIIKDFPLAYTNFQLSTLGVKVDDVSKPFTYKSLTNTVRVEDAGGPRSKVLINYCSRSGEDLVPSP
jgi:hypothetical protein